VFISEWFKITGDWSDSFQTLLVHLPVLLPKYYLYGMDMVANDVRNGRPAFLFGDVSDKGWWYYFPAAFVLKTTIPFLLLTVSGIAWTIWETVRRRWLDGLYLVLPPLIYLGLSMSSHLNIGVRHIMPVLLFFAVMGAGAISAFLNIERLKGRHLSKILVGFLVASISLIAIVTFPDYTTYFSPLAGGAANGWRQLSDSNVETGQDVKSLAAFLKALGENHIEGLFVGSGQIEYYGVDNCELPCGSEKTNQSDVTDKDEESEETDKDDESKDTGDKDDTEVNDEQKSVTYIPREPANYIAIGAWYLEEINLTPEQKAVIDPYRRVQPEAVIGNAIFVFRRNRD